MKEKIKYILKTIIQFIVNPRLLLCFGIAWLITNGWSYIFIGIGTFMDIKWMVAVGSSYLAFLWLPITPEKIVTVSISIALLRVLFPNDQKTLAVLKTMYAKARRSVNKMFAKEKEKKPQERLKDILSIVAICVLCVAAVVLIIILCNK